MSDRTRIKVSPEVAAYVVADLDDAIRRRSVAEIINFSREAEASGLDQAAARGREIAALLEAKAAQSGRDEVRIKAAMEPPEPTQAELIRRFDAEQMSTGATFSSADFEATERDRVAEQNRQLAAKNREAEKQRAAEIAHDEQPERPWWQ